MRKLRTRDKKLIKLIKEGGRKGAREDFFELLGRSVKFKKLVKNKKP